MVLFFLFTYFSCIINYPGKTWHISGNQLGEKIYYFYMLVSSSASLINQFKNKNLFPKYILRHGLQENLSNDQTMSNFDSVFLASGDPPGSFFGAFRGKTAFGQIKAAWCPPAILVPERVPTFHCFQMLQNTPQSSVGRCGKGTRSITCSLHNYRVIKGTAVMTGTHSNCKTDPETRTWGI